MTDEPAPNLQVVPGSERGAVPGAQPAGPLDPAQVVDVTLVLRRRGELPASVSAGGQVLDRTELAQVAGANPADIELVDRVLTGLGLSIRSSDPATRLVRVAGPVGRLAQVFGTRLELVNSPHPGSGDPTVHRHRTGELSVPAELGQVVVAVLGLDDRPQARAHIRWAPGAPGPAAAGAASFTPLQLGAAYRFPAGTDGAGQNLAIIELGGGYADSDLQTYFAGLGVPVPKVTAVGVDGAVNVPGQDPQGADGEVLLDIEVAGALAPAAALLVYFAPNSDAGFLDAVSTAAHASPAPTAMSISWGQSEDAWTAQARGALDQAMADAAALGVTVTVAAGDDGSSDRVTDGAVHVDFPAASPHALACGGTALVADPATAVVTDETVWNNPGHGATGGGVSDAFGLPAWQANVGVPARVGGAPGSGAAGSGGAGSPGRGVPDVAADADPATGYAVYVDGQARVIGGTSAVARCGRRWCAAWCRRWADRLACCSRPCTPPPCPGSRSSGCATSPAVLTAPTAPALAGMPAPGSACQMAPHC